MSGRAEPGPVPPTDGNGQRWRNVASAMLERSGGISGMVAAAVPTIVFVVGNGLSSLYPALLATAAAAVLIFGWRLARRQPLRQALAGLLIAGVCAALAAYTGQAKGFFLATVLLPALGVVVCVGSVLARRPLAGYLVNRIAGGQAGWRKDRRLLRIYSGTTLLSAAVNVVSFGLQTALYRANQTAWLAAFHILTGPLWAAITITTVMLARRAIKRGPAPAS